jgi:hypothetical protein
MPKNKVLNPSENKPITLVKVDSHTWKQFRLYCLANSISCFDGVNQLIEDFLKEQKFNVKVKRNENA